jgi:hypothetical protein
MNNRQAKDILLLYRPGNAAQDESEFSQALALAEQDPELGSWFKDHCAVQDSLRAKFSEIPVPDGLKEQILSERKAQIALPGKRKLALVAACCVLVLLLVGITFSLLRPHEDKTFANFHTRMVRIAARQYPAMDLETHDAGKIRRYLADKRAHGDFAVPESLAKTTSTGCAILQWHGKTVSMVCFNSGKNVNPNEPDLFLFIANRGDVPHAPRANGPQFGQTNQLATASWSQGDKVYLLAGQGDEAFIRKFVE